MFWLTMINPSHSTVTNIGFGHPARLWRKWTIYLHNIERPWNIFVLQMCITHLMFRTQLPFCSSAPWTTSAQLFIISSYFASSIANDLCYHSIICVFPISPFPNDSVWKTLLSRFITCKKKIDEKRIKSCLAAHCHGDIDTCRESL